jgi:hypothetical protein
VSVFALVSAKGSPGVSVTALALGLFWPARSLVAECDPAGGDALAGLLQGQLEADRGITNLAVAAGRGRLESEFWHQLVDLDAPHQRRLLLPGVSEPSQSGGLAAIWDRLAALFTTIGDGESGVDVLADCGRLSTVNAPWPLLQAADAVALVVRPTLPGLAHGLVAADELRRRLPGHAGRLGLVVVDDGPYTGEAGKRLGLPVFGVLPADHRTAAALSLGGRGVRHTDRLVRAVGEVGEQLRALGPARTVGAAHAG